MPGWGQVWGHEAGSSVLDRSPPEERCRVQLNNNNTSYTPCADQRQCNKRQANLHDCLPSLPGDGDKWIEIVYGEEKNILYWAD